MGRKTGDGLPTRVKKVRDQIVRWRRSRRQRSAMPAPLWDAGVSLARSKGTYAMAQALRVDYGSLARRVAEARGGGVVGRGGAGAGLGCGRDRGALRAPSSEGGAHGVVAG